MLHVMEVFLGLVICVAGLALLARRLAVPYPILLVLGGLLLGLIPGLPRVGLNPELVFLVFLPPLLYPAALFTSWRDFRANLSPILLLAIGLVLFTTAAVGWLAHSLVPELPLAAGLVLGAIISPPDAIAAIAIAERLRLPRRIVSILEGESLVNDATALVAYRFAVAAVVTGSFAWGDVAARFVIVGIGGLLVGLGVGWVAGWIHQRLDDPPIQITISLLTPFAAYLPAEQLQVSGVLAVVAAGLYLGWRMPEISSSRMRLQAYPVWEMIVFLLNGCIFILIGLQLPEVLRGLSGRSPVELLGAAALAGLVVIAVRAGWVFASAWVPRFLFKRIRRRHAAPAWKHVAVVAWTGMRGVVSLAAAMALPLSRHNGSPFPGRDLILFLTFTVILITLVLQGLTLPLLIRRLGVRDDHAAEKEEREARLKANQAALARLHELASNQAANNDPWHRLRTEYEDRIRQLEVCEPESDTGPRGLFSSEYEQLSQEALDVERKTILQLRNEKIINDEVLRRIQRDIDLAEARLRR